MQIVVTNSQALKQAWEASTINYNSTLCLVDSSSFCLIVEAIRRKASLTTAKISSVLLLGHWTELPPVMVTTTKNSAVFSDSLFGDLDGDGLGEIPVGRIPSVQALKNSNENLKSIAQRNALTLSYNHPDYLNSAATHSRFLKSCGYKVYHRPANKFSKYDVYEALDRGPLQLLTYFGHSNCSGWLGYHGGIFFQDLVHVNKTVNLVLSPTCSILHPQHSSFGLSWIEMGKTRNFFGATAVTFTQENAIFVRAFSEVLKRENVSLGDGIANGIQALMSHNTPEAKDNLLVYNLVGNPENSI